MADRTCVKCGGLTERGRFQTGGIVTGNIKFVLPRAPTSRNPLTAFKQGLSDEPTAVEFNLSEITGVLCTTCGHLELELVPPGADR